MTTAYPTEEEQQQFSISAYRGIEVGIGLDDPLAVMANRLELEYPGHLILIQAGSFMHAFDRSAHALNVLKKYKLKLIGTTSEPHLRVGFPVGLEKKAARNKVQNRLWPLVHEFQIPYVALIGNQKDGYESFGSDRQRGNASILSAITDDIVQRVIRDLQQIGAVNTAAAKQLLANPNVSGFKLKESVQELEMHLLNDLLGMSRDLRSTWGENVRVCMARIMRNVFAFGTSRDRDAVLHEISADVDLLKHYLTQAARMNKLKIAFEHRVNLAVEIGRLVGGLIRSEKVSA